MTVVHLTILFTYINEDPDFPTDFSQFQLTEKSQIESQNNYLGLSRACLASVVITVAPLDEEKTGLLRMVAEPWHEPGAVKLFDLIFLSLSHSEVEFKLKPFQLVFRCLVNFVYTNLSL